MAGPIPGGVCSYFPLIKVRKNILGKISVPIILSRGGGTPIPGVGFQGRKSFKLSVAAPVAGPRRAADHRWMTGVQGRDCQARGGAGCPPAGAEKPRRRRLYLFAGFVLSWRRREDSALRTKTLGDFFGARGPKTFFDRGAQGCRIISV
jgi:hypothetical protein